MYWRRQGLVGRASLNCLWGGWRRLSVTQGQGPRVVPTRTLLSQEVRNNSKTLDIYMTSIEGTTSPTT